MREPKAPRTRPRWRPCCRVISSRMPLASPCRLTPSTMPSSVHCMGLYHLILRDALSRVLLRTRLLKRPHGEERGQRPRVSNHAGESQAPSILGKLQPHGAVALRIVAPALAHLDEQEQVHLVLDDLGDFAPRRFANRLERLPVFADDDLALAFALHVDRLLDANVAAAQFLPRLGLDRRMIGQLLMQPCEQLFPGDLG